MTETKGYAWADIDAEWSAIGDHQLDLALSLLQDEIRKGRNERLIELINRSEDESKMQSAMRNRLYQARKSWQHARRQKRKLEAKQQLEASEVRLESSATGDVNTLSNTPSSTGRSGVMNIASILQT